MKIAVLKEAAGETRCAAIPETVKKFIALGADVAVETGAGDGATIFDADFEGAGVAGGDVLDLSGIDAVSTIVGNQAFQWLGMNVAFTNSVGDLRAFWQGNNTVVQGDVNGDGKADFSIALTGRLNLSAGDMVL